MTRLASRNPATAAHPTTPKEGFLAIPYSLVLDSELRDRALQTYCLLCMNREQYWVRDLTVAEIAGSLNTCDETVGRALSILEQRGHIRKKQRGRRKSNVYILLAFLPQKAREVKEKKDSEPTNVPDPYILHHVEEEKARSLKSELSPPLHVDTDDPVDPSSEDEGELPASFRLAADDPLKQLRKHKWFPLPFYLWHLIRFPPAGVTPHAAYLACWYHHHRKPVSQSDDQDKRDDQTAAINDFLRDDCLNESSVQSQLEAEFKERQEAMMLARFKLNPGTLQLQVLTIHENSSKAGDPDA